MTTPYTPLKGHFFYVRGVGEKQEADSDGSLFSILRETLACSEYDGEIFQCLARDETGIVGARAKFFGSTPECPPVLLIRRMFEFSPVGPEVVKALKLNELSKEISDEA